MKAIDEGHLYQLDDLRGGPAKNLSFYKDDKINGSHRDGCSLQEVLRACIDRVHFLNKQKPASENGEIVMHMRHALRLLESRAARISVEKGDPIERAAIGIAGHWHK